MKRYHVSGKPQGLPEMKAESASKVARNRERIAAANAKKARPKTKKQWGITNDPSLRGWIEPRAPRGKEES